MADPELINKLAKFSTKTEKQMDIFIIINPIHGANLHIDAHMPRYNSSERISHQEMEKIVN